MNLIDISTYIIETPEVLVAGLFAIGYFIKSHIAAVKERRLYIYKMINQRFNGPDKTYKDLYEIKMLINDIPKYFNLSSEIFNAINNFSDAATNNINAIGNEYDNLILSLDKQAKFVWNPFLNKFRYKYQFNNIKQYHPNMVTQHEINEYSMIAYLSIINKLSETDRNIIIELISKYGNSIKNIPEWLKSKEPK